MAHVGIIANPAAGKDIRRLVAHASTFDNNEKVNIIRRVLLGLQAAGVDEVRFMPDAFGIGARALRGLDLALRVTFLDLDPRFESADSTRAAELLRDQGAGCIISLGGDGTNRAVAKGCGDTPLLPISSGTNNVFPRMIEGTIAGLAAGVVARRVVDPAVVTQPTPCLILLRDDEMVDLALIDIVVSDERFVGARAVWDARLIRQIITTHADPSNIGFASVGGYIGSIQFDPGEGLTLYIGTRGTKVLAPIAPGLIGEVGVLARRRLKIGGTVAIRHTPAVLALDGERELTIRAGERVQVRLSEAGPRVVDVRCTLQQAAEQGFFIREENDGA